MKKKFILFLLLPLSCIQLFTACDKDPDPNDIPQPVKTMYTFDGIIGTVDNSALIINGSDVVICGNTGSKISLLKITVTGVLSWRKDFAAGLSSSASAIAESANHDLFVCGSTLRNQSATMKDVLMVKTNANGDTLLSRTYGGSKDDAGYQIISSNDGNMVICGYSYSFTTEAFYDIFLIKINTQGDTLWTRTYADNDQETPYHLMQTQDGGYLISGTNQDNGLDRELYLLKTDANGNKLWDKKIGPATGKQAFSTIELSNGDLLTCGKHPAPIYTKVLIVKTNPLGEVIWEKEIGEEFLAETGNSIKQNSDGTFTIAGTSYNDNSMYNDILLLKIDAQGNQLWRKTYGGALSDYGINLNKDFVDYNIVTGNTRTYVNNVQVGNIFMSRLDNNGDFK